MTIIKRTGYLTTNNCDAMVAALPTLPDAAGKEYRNSDAGGNQVSSYKILRNLITTCITITIFLSSSIW
jgi:hypothetical protein